MLAPGTRAPEIRATELDGTQVAVSDLLARGPVLAAFFKVSCPTCQYTFPFLQRMADRKGLTIIGISQDEAGPTRAFCENLRSTIPCFAGRGREQVSIEQCVQAEKRAILLPH